MKTGSSRHALLAALLVALLSAGTLVSDAQEKSQSYSVVAGTVFKESGLSLAGANVTLTPEPVEGQKRKPKSLSAVSDSRGEFAFRVPPVAAKYVVSATMKGYSPETKTVAVSPDERIDVTFTLRAESK